MLKNEDIPKATIKTETSCKIQNSFTSKNDTLDKDIIIRKLNFRNLPGLEVDISTLSPNSTVVCVWGCCKS